jgi:hypothetical protein
LPVVLYGCETWNLTLREELWLRLFENRVLRRIFEPTTEERRGCAQNCIKRSSMICSGDKIEKNEMGRAGSTHGARRVLYRVLEGKSEGNRKLRITSHR